VNVNMLDRHFLLAAGPVFLERVHLDNERAA
jgi:hypothetical protein